MRSLHVSPAPQFRPDGGFSPKLARLRQSNPVVALLLTWDDRHKSRAALQRLGDAGLADIGLTRAAAESEAAKPFWRA